MPKNIFTQELEGTRRRGRPRKRCKEEVQRDLQVLGVRRWRELVADRKKWKDSKMSHPRSVYINNRRRCQSVTQQYLKRCLIKDDSNYMFRPNVAVIRFSSG